MLPYDGNDQVGFIGDHTDVTVVQECTEDDRVQRRLGRDRRRKGRRGIVPGGLTRRIYGWYHRTRVLDNYRKSSV